MVYLFIGHDSLSKDIQLNKIKQELLAHDTQEFNFDVLYAQELTLKKLQEKFLCLPVASSQRLIVIKAAELLKEEVKEYILAYAAKPYKSLSVVLDVYHYDYRDVFLKGLLKYTKVIRFKEEAKSDTFLLARQINAHRPDAALRVLNQLLEDGQRPERILGGLRFVFEKEGFAAKESKRKLRLLLQCDSEIKTGKLKANFAIEKLVIALSSLVSSVGTAPREGVRPGIPVKGVSASL